MSWKELEWIHYWKRIIQTYRQSEKEENNSIKVWYKELEKQGFVTMDDGEDPPESNEQEMEEPPDAEQPNKTFCVIGMQPKQHKLVTMQNAIRNNWKLERSKKKVEITESIIGMDS